MNTLDKILIVLTALAVLFSALTVVLTRRKSRKIMNSLNCMLDKAAAGEFSETLFDESLLSALETRLAHFLEDSVVTTQNLCREKEKIKELIADISHQTKTPIANILLYAQLLSEQDLSQEGRTCAQALNGQAEKLNFLVGALVKTSRLETGIFTLHPKATAIKEIWEQVEEQIRSKAEAKGIVLEVEDTELTAVFDLKWTVEAIFNIVDNAVKYTAEGGHISIRVSEYELFIKIDIEDTGIGIAEEEYPRIFGRFYRSPEVSSTEGVGIGLYLTRQIIEDEGGYLKVISEPLKGSTFSVFLRS